VNGATPTISGLRLLPMILGVLITSITSGQLIPEVRLRTTTQATDVGHTFAMPMARSSQEEIERALQVLASR
jgi:hypothetical protein